MSAQSESEALWRDDRPVFVSDVETLGAIAVMRSLGRAGYPVHAASLQDNALGLASRYARMRVVCPPYRGPHFIEWLRDYIRRHRIAAIVPSEDLLLVLRPHFSEFSPLLPFSRDPGVLYAGLSKHDLFASLQQVCAPNLPPLALARPGAVPKLSELRSLGRPLYVKVDACHSSDLEGGVFRCATAEAARQRLEQLLGPYRCALVQGHVNGQGVGVFALRWQGQILAEFMHRRVHEVPHTGGASSLRESWWHQQMRDDAIAKLHHLDWQGVAMMEYRWDASGNRFALMEMNGRFWGSLHLALYAGVDFPRLLLDAHLGRPASEPASFSRGVQCRHTFPGEVQHVWSVYRDPNCCWRQRAGALRDFVRLSLDPAVFADLGFPGDRGLYWTNLARFCREYGRLLLGGSR